MEFPDARERRGTAGTDVFQQALRAVAQVLEGWVFGKRFDRHGDLLPRALEAAGYRPAVRYRARKTLIVAKPGARVGLALSADRERPARSPGMLPLIPLSRNP